MAYVATKPQVTTWRLTMQEPPLKVCRALPKEIVNMIVSSSYLELLIFYILLPTRVPHTRVQTLTKDLYRSRKLERTTSSNI